MIAGIGHDGSPATSFPSRSAFARSLVPGGAVLAEVGAFVLTQIGGGSGEAWSALAALVIGFGLGAVGAPTMGSLYRTLPAEKVPQGSSVLYKLHQLGVACVALILAAAGTGGVSGGIGGFQQAYREPCPSGYTIHEHSFCAGLVMACEGSPR
ncbi:hypothetical protein [Nocardiopsis rhodophaea]|uniref:hypothetical protein n=1 Tax=Nocardiopsis rhodophaea TaxID=280238 RepID=UPI0031DAD4C5